MKILDRSSENFLRVHNWIQGFIAHDPRINCEQVECWPLGYIYHFGQDTMDVKWGKGYGDCVDVYLFNQEGSRYPLFMLKVGQPNKFRNITTPVILQQIVDDFELRTDRSVDDACARIRTEVINRVGGY